MAKIKYQITKRSPVDGGMHTIEFEAEPADMDRWKQQGQLIQYALPYLTADQREFLMTGITKEQWDELFGGGTK